MAVLAVFDRAQTVNSTRDLYAEGWEEGAKWVLRQVEHWLMHHNSEHVAWQAIAEVGTEIEMQLHVVLSEPATSTQGTHAQLGDNDQEDAAGSVRSTVAKRAQK